MRMPPLNDIDGVMYASPSETRVRIVAPQILYNCLQMVLFAFIAFIIMRLKLFWTPHLCIVAALLASRAVSESTSCAENC